MASVADRQNLLDGAKPVVSVRFHLLSIHPRSFFVFPVGNKSLFCYLVHTVGTDLHFYPSSLLTHQG